jgi:CRISPR-associated protein Cas5t
VADVARLFLRVQAPFAAFRWMQAGVYRATSPVIPPSAAWGLVLNLAGVETRAPGPGVTTLVRADAPALRLAVGSMSGPEPEVATLYQQLHGYPVGNSSKALADGAHGAKYHIAPARRELLVGLDAVIGVETPDGELLRRVRAGLAGELTDRRYGVLFAGDNNLMVDRVTVSDEAPEAWWYARVEPGMSPRRGSCRLTVGIDRDDSSRTTSAVYAPLEARCSDPPEGAWTWAPRAPG